MKPPRDLGGEELARKLAKYGYVITRQKGSHMRLTTQTAGKHHVTIPVYKTLPVDVLDAILGDIAGHLKMKKSDLVADLMN